MQRRVAKGFKQRVREFANLSKSALFTLIVHGVLIAALLVGLWWPYSEKKAEVGSVEPIKAEVVSSDVLQEYVDREKQKIEEEKKAAEELEALKKQQEEEKKKLEELEEERKKEEQQLAEMKEKEKQLEIEAEKKREAEEKARIEAEEKKKAEEAEKKRLEEEEKKKQEEAEKKRQEEEKRRKEEEEKKRVEEEIKRQEEAARKAREAELQKQLQAEQSAQNEREAVNAFESYNARIKNAVESNWRRPANSRTGLRATIRVNVDRNGNVLSANVVKSSGDPFFDRSAELAVNKASPLPFPTDPKYYEYIKVFDLVFNPDG